MHLKGLGADSQQWLAAHGVSLLVFVGLATAFLWEVLFADKSLAAFDIILSQPNWYGEFPIHGVHQAILLDSPTAHYPQRMLDWSAVRQGINATFNPYIFTGMPWSPQGVGAFLTSFPQLFLELPDALDWSTWIRLVLAGFFMYLFLIELGLGRAVSTFGGVVWAYNLHQIVWLMFPQHLATQLWIPLLFLANVWILQRGFRREYVLALMLVNVLFFTSGYTQIVLYTYLAVGLFNTLYLLALAEGSMRQRTKRWLLIHLVYIGAALFYAAGIYSEMEFIHEGLRGAQDFRGRVTDFGLDWQLITAFFKSLFPAVEEIKRLYTPDYYGGIWEGSYRDQHQGNIVESSAYMGGLAVVFALAAVFALRNSARRGVVLIFLILLGLSFSAYHQNALTISLLKLIPLADKGSYGRFITLIIFFGCVVAAFGLQEISECGPRAARMAWSRALAAFLILPVAAWVIDSDLMLTRLMHPLLIVSLVVVTAMIFVLPAQKQRALRFGVVALAAADLFYAAYDFNTRMYNDRIFPANNAIRFLLTDITPYRTAVLSEQPLYRSNLLSYFRIPTVEGYSTVLPNRYATFISAVFDRHHVTHNGMLFLFSPDIRALRLMNTKYVLSDQRLTDPKLEEVLKSNEHYIYRIRDWLPRAYCASDILHVGQDTVYERLRGAIAALDRPALISEVAPETYGGDCEVADIQTFVHGASFTVNAPAARLVVLPYAFVQGWRAWIGDERLSIIPVNGAFLGVRVPAGVSRVVLRYWNVVDMVGAAILIGGAFTLIWLLLASPLTQSTHLIMIPVAVIVIGKSALSFAGLVHRDLPERSPLRAPPTVDHIGVDRSQSAQTSPKIGPERAITVNLDVPAQGLTKLGFKAATYLQAYLPYDLMVILKDASGRELARERVAGEHIIDNGWFFIDIPTLQVPVETDITAIISAVSDPIRPFSLWLDDAGRPSIRAFYERNPTLESSP